MNQLKTRQVCFFLIAFLPITKFFSLPSLIAKSAGHDMWLSVLISLLLDFITLLPIVIACKTARKNLFEILEETFSKTGAKAIAVLYVIYFIAKAILPLNEQKDYVDFTLYTLKPSILYFLPIFLLGFYMCFKKLRFLGRIADILWLITINGFITLIVLSISNADFSAILPIGTHKISDIFSASFNSLAWFGDAVFIMFFIGRFKYEKHATLKILLSFFAGAIMVLAFMIIFYSIFSYIAFRQRFALTEISKYTTVISNLGRIDYLGIIMILFSNMFAICLPIYFVSKLLDYIFKFKKVWIAPTISVVIQLFISVFLNEYIYGIEKIITGYFGYYFLLVGNVLPIIFAIIAIKKEKVYAIKKG